MRDQSESDTYVDEAGKSVLQWSVIIPMRDEAGNVAPLTAEIKAAMTNLGSFEIVAVDDGSVDATARELRLAVSDAPMLRVVTHDSPVGQSQALITGALAARGAVLIFIDGDGQNDPADIPALVSAHRNLGASGHAGLVIGRRRMRTDGAIKAIASRIAALARRVLLADPAPDAGCGLKVIARDAFLALPRFDAVHRFMPALVARLGGAVASVPIAHRPRRCGHSAYGVVKRGLVGLIDLLGVAWLIARHRRPTIKR